jgi:hypothetical protein
MSLNLENIPANKSAKGVSKLLLQDVVEFTIQVEHGTGNEMMVPPMKKSG